VSNQPPTARGAFAAAALDPLASVGPWIVGGATGVAAWFLHQSAADAAFTALCCLVLAHISVVDLRERRIPNRYTYAGTPIALLAAFLRGDAFVQALLGTLAATLAMGVLYLVSRGRLGMGDVKLGGFAGAILGLQAVPTFLLVSTLLGTLAALFLLIRTRDRHTLFAYGPYMATAAGTLLVLRGPAGA
jgi:Flp pilus assembly protein protease CpaA